MPIYSDFITRVVFWFIFVEVGIAQVMLYARKIKKDPTKSIVYEEDKERNFEQSKNEQESFTGRHRIIIRTLLITVVVLAFGVI